MKTPDWAVVRSLEGVELEALRSSNQSKDPYLDEGAIEDYGRYYHLASSTSNKRYLHTNPDTCSFCAAYKNGLSESLAVAGYNRPGLGTGITIDQWNKGLTVGKVSDLVASLTKVTEVTPDAKFALLDDKLHIIDPSTSANNIVVPILPSKRSS